MTRHLQDKGIEVVTCGALRGAAANKVPGVRAALCVDAFGARISKPANNELDALYRKGPAPRP